MDQILVDRLALRKKRLKECLDSVKGLLKQGSETGAIHEEELLRAQLTLKSSLNCFKEENMTVLQKVSSSTLQTIGDDGLEVQINAEDVLVEIDILLQSVKKPSVSKEGMHSKLPKLELSKFDGNVLSWNSFWDRFEANVNNKNIADVEKLAYLFSSLEGTALQAVEGLETTNSNYLIAVDLLKNRFGKPEHVIDAHNDALHKIPRATAGAVECRRTLNLIEKHLRVLEALGEKVDASHLRVIVINKFPENIVYQVKLMTINDSSIVSIRKALDTVIFALEQSEVVVSPVESVVTPQLNASTASTSILHVKSKMNVTNKRKWKNFNKQDRQSKIKKSRMTCIFCDGTDHYSEDCTKYTSYLERKGRLQDRCYICFRTGHRASKCPMKKKCVHCTKMHNRALCPRKTCATRTNEGKEHCKTDVLTTTDIYDEPHHFLQTAVTQVKVGESGSLTSRLLLDSGSQRSYITSRLAKKLYIEPVSEDFLMIYTFGSNKPREVSSPSAEIIIITKRGVERKIRVNIVPHITERVPIASFNSSEIDITADDDSTGENIDLLIGNDLYFSFIRKEIIKVEDHVYLVDSDFGWLITGSFVNNKNEAHLSVITYCQCHDTSCPYFTEPDLPLRSIDVKFLWALDSIGITDSPKTTSEEEAVQYFNETVKYSDGRYQVKWPWIQYPPELPSNYGLAYGRLKGLLRRSNEDMLKEYDGILKEQLDAKIIEIVEPVSYQQTTHPVHYLPHHMVQQPGKKGRIVYDASSKIKNEKSLNECLYRGPSMLEDLMGLVLKFRSGKIGVTADVEKAFLQVGLQQPDRDVTRFLWVKDPTNNLTEDNIIQYRFCRVPFGIISSPFLLAATIRYHISKTNKELLSKIADRCYVDNLVTSTNTLNEAQKLYEDTTKIFNVLGMNIRDWMSNNKQFIDNIPETQRAKQKDKMKILGLLWNIEEDTLQLKIDNNSLGNDVTEKSITKKGVLRVLARLYDPCGFVSPLVLPGKLLLQELCTRKLKWDDVLPEDLLSSWKIILNDFLAIGDFKIDRHIGNNFPGKIIEYELHGFTDASLNAYAAVVYLRVISNNNITTSFLMSKSRVTPTEDKSHLKIPRLELLGYLIGSRLLKYIKGHLDINISQSYLWTDSEVVLAWMISSKLLPPFVSRRINEIKQIKDALNLKLCYVNTKENPADIATRPDSWHEKQELWLHGPIFLKKEQKYWPKNRHMNESNICLAGRALDFVDGPEMSLKGYDDEMVPYNSACEEITMTEENEESSDVLSSPTDDDVKLFEIKKLQKTYFPEEISGKETSLSRNLGLFLDEDGLLRCKGRLTNTCWSYDKKYPILIPRDVPFTVQTIQKVHEENYHVGVSHTLSILRNKYWIPQGRAQVQKILRKCPQCVKHGGGPYRIPPAPALPRERVNYSPPFTYTGLDYLGPILITTSKGREKRWICLLTCLAVRALHLELVRDLTAEECLMALRRFIATRGIPNVIISDNALQFKLTSEVLSSSYCKENSIKWKFIAQLAPWQGGFYERLVGLVKHCLKRTLGKHLLTESQMQTVIKEVESVLNTRPLTTVGSEVEEVLRPADFLTLGKCLEIHSSFEESTLQGTNTKVDLVKGWKRGQIILEEYKSMFINQYLPSLRERFNQSRKQPRVKSLKQPKIGDIVQIKDDSKNRINWKVGKITSLVESRDGDCRVAKVMVGKTEFTRSLSHLYPLEADACIEEVEQVPIGESDHPIYGSNMLEPLSLHKLRIFDTPSEPTEADKCEENLMQIGNEVSEQTITPDLVMPEVMPVLDSEESNTTQIEQNTTLEERALEELRPMSSTAEVSSTKRSAAIRAREKIAEWTRQLVTLI